MGLFNKAVSYHIIHPDVMFPNEANKNYSGEYISSLVTCQKVIAQQPAKFPLEVYINDATKGQVKHTNLINYFTQHKTSIQPATTSFRKCYC